MKRTQVNPWAWWPDRYQIAQAWRIDNPNSVVLISGQGAITSEGTLTCVGDFEGQVRQTFDNIVEVLEASGASLSDVVKMTVYLTDMSNMESFGRVRREYFGDLRPAVTALGTPELAAPDALVEVDVVAFPDLA